MNRVPLVAPMAARSQGPYCNRTKALEAQNAVVGYRAKRYICPVAHDPAVLHMARILVRAERLAGLALALGAAAQVL